jgi:hypothetical protein
MLSVEFTLGMQAKPHRGTTRKIADRSPHGERMNLLLWKNSALQGFPADPSTGLSKCYITDLNMFFLKNYSKDQGYPGFFHILAQRGTTLA